tara:strand:- start:4888 stop:6417 length:1530 start_codon:yes stop_codon:yes gene_type:complete
MSKKFNGHRCERRNLTDLVLGTGPAGNKRPAPKAKKRSKNFTTEPAVNQMYLGGPYTDYNAMFAPQQPMASPSPGAPSAPSDPGHPSLYQRIKLKRLASSDPAGPGGPTMAPGQFPDFLKQYLGGQGNMSLASSGGQAAGQFITGMSDTANDPTAKYGVGEGFGAAVSGAFNPLAMSLGPLGMVGGAALGLGKSLFSHSKEKNAFEEAQEKLAEEHIASNVANAQDFSRQALSTYDQQGVGGGYYARRGGPVDKFYTGGPTEPPYEATANPFRAPVYGGNQGTFRQDNSPVPSDFSFGDAMSNVANYHLDKPLDALGMDLAIAGQVPLIGEVADLANAGISGARGLYNSVTGDTAKAQEQFALAGLSAASAIPFIGNAAGVARVGAQSARIAKGAHKIEKGVIGAKGIKAGTYESYAMGGPVDYETEKSEVILASPNDPPVAVGQGQYNRISGNLYKGNGPSHEQGGIPTRGATEPFIDNAGQPMDSPYVFSDSKDMRFNADEILSMIR